MEFMKFMAYKTVNRKKFMFNFVTTNYFSRTLSKKSTNKSNKKFLKALLISIKASLKFNLTFPNIKRS